MWQNQTMQRLAGGLLGIVCGSILIASCSSQGKIGGTQVTSTATGSRCEVNLKEYEILMPDTVPAGSVTFKVSNTGKHDHSFHIKGNGIDQGLEGGVKPAESKDLTVTLAAGTYDIECPVTGHAALGMHRKLTVTPAR
jgi:uncharacterized cupredoxin-like copper-binding protein